MAHDRRTLRQRADGRTAVVLDCRTLQSTAGSRRRVGGYKRRNGSQTRGAVVALNHLLARRVTPADT